MKTCPYCKKRPIRPIGNSKRTCGNIKCQYLRHLEVMRPNSKKNREQKNSQPKKGIDRALMV